MRKFILKNRKLSIVSKIIIIMVWMLLSKIIDNEIIFPTVKSTFASLIDTIKEPNFLNTIKYSLIRSIIGFLISLSLAMLTGILSSISKIIYNIMVPILKFLSSVPTMAIIILALIWLSNELAPMFVGFIMVFPILYETVLNGILDVDKDIVDMAQLYKVDKITIIKDIYLPSIFLNLSLVFTSTLGINLKMVIAGEALAQPKYGIGSNLQLQKTYLNTSGVFAWIIIILLIAKLFNYLINGVKYLMDVDRWK
ncbi:ABC transporter, permease protein [[Clostridium] ultunense Esp]|uniref:ABC transporter, permease protein n=1 Tax=[Clostridium] ultunense Esp TaxID=1288971 RepID=M1YSJ2_9FIRM|nr:ABC transporter permease subunit [Schnuerera ultunensis]CCQ93530.1 ABC transporter, permease protein [[Clostridium] ultunense Esp]SHD75469.1 ABC transporter, permease protein [[Clostridium] ultunense Esp]